MMSRRFSVMKHRRRVFGLDPGLARCGWAVIDAGSQPRLVAAGCLITPATDPEAVRLARLHRRLGQLVRRYRPKSMAVEKLYFTTNVSTAMAVGQARGIALLAAAEAKLPVQEFPPTTVKRAVTGDGRADKRQLENMVMRLLELDRAPRYDDTVDAMAVALCGLQTRMLP